MRSMDDKTQLEEEISLMDLYDVLVRRKKLILVVIVLAILLSGGGVMVMRNIGPTIYEAVATVMVSPISPPPLKGETAYPPLKGETAYSVLLDYLSQYPQLTIDTYISQVKNPRVISKIVDKLGIDMYNNNGYLLEKLMTAEFVNGTNILELKVRNEDPELAKLIANTWAAEFTDFISDVVEGQMEKYIKFIESQVQEGYSQMEKAMDSLKTFLSQPPSVTELQKEIDTKTTLITNYKQQLVELEVQLQNLQATRQNLQSQTNEETLNQLLVSLAAQPRNITELQKEIDTKTTLITNYKQQLVELEVQEEKERVTLLKLKELLVKEPLFWELRKSIVEDPILTGFLASGQGISDLAGLTMKSQEINQNYIQLEEFIHKSEVSLEGILSSKKTSEEKIKTIQNEINALQIMVIDRQIKELQDQRENLFSQTINPIQNEINALQIMVIDWQNDESLDRKGILATNIAMIQTDINEKQSLLASKQGQMETLEQQYELARSNYQTFSTKYQELRVAAPSRIGEMNIMVVSEAITPHRPAPSKYSLLLTVAIGLVLGVMVALLLAFFLEFRQNYLEYRQEKRKA